MSKISYIDELQKGVEAFYKAICENKPAVYSAEICIVTFGDKATCLTEFASIEYQKSISKLKPTAGTFIGKE